MDSAAKVIISKGFENTTMEEIIAGTTLSKGGVYHYYRNVIEIFKDIMIEGIKYRENVISKNLMQSNKKISKEFIVKQIVEKILDDNKFVPLYVEFLINKDKIPQLNELRKQLEQKTKDGLNKIFKELDDDNDYFDNDDLFFLIGDFIDAMIISANLLKTKERLRNNKKILEQIIDLMIENYKEEKK